MFKRTHHPAWMFLCAATLLLLSALSALAQVAPVGPTGGTDAATQQSANSAQQALPIAPVQRLHIVPVLDPNAAAIAPAAPAGAHLSYFGGPIISNVQVVQVLYGSGSYNSQVAGNTSPTMGNFFADITSTGLITLFQQYNTNISGGTN